VSTGKIKQLVHLTRQTHVCNAGLVSGHNEHGYGLIEDEDQHDIYFSYEAVAGQSGFDDLRQGQPVEYTLEDGPYLRAASVRVLPVLPFPRLTRRPDSSKKVNYLFKTP
jgi:cold shock CspA family protein